MLGTFAGAGLGLVVVLAAAPVYANAPSDDDSEAPDFYDPRRRSLPRPHRFRLGVELDYVRLSVAINSTTGNRQRFHMVPLQLDFAYQAQFLRYFMVRPSIAIGSNVGNTFVSMPLFIHPKIHAGYQGALFGAAVGYGFIDPPIRNKDYVSTIRGGEGRPVYRNAHHIDVEASVTTRLHRRRQDSRGAGALSVIVRIGAVRGRLEHFETVNRRWRFMFSFNVGWYFGDGRRWREQRAARKAEKKSTFPAR